MPKMSVKKITKGKSINARMNGNSIFHPKDLKEFDNEKLK
jgi:hypothetical protein